MVCNIFTVTFSISLQFNHGCNYFIFIKIKLELQSCLVHGKIFCWISNFLLWVHLLDQHAEHKHVSPDQEQNSMLKVICNQRDRFRARLQETEEVCCFCFYN